MPSAIMQATATAPNAITAITVHMGALFQFDRTNLAARILVEFHGDLDGTLGRCAHTHCDQRRHVTGADGVIWRLAWRPSAIVQLKNVAVRLDVKGVETPYLFQHLEVIGMTAK